MNDGVGRCNLSEDLVVNETGVGRGTCYEKFRSKEAGITPQQVVVYETCGFLYAGEGEELEVVIDSQLVI